MTKRSDMSIDGCEAARVSIHDVLDGEHLHPELKRSLDEHLAACAECRETEQDLRTLQQGLRGLPQPPMPDDAFEAVLKQTSQNVRAFRKPVKKGHVWKFAAAAAMIMAVSWGLWPQEPDEAELRLAATQARMVLKLTAKAVNRAERAVVDQVLGEGVSPALRRVPLQWPAATGDKRGDREDGTDDKT
jgi:anti-sigma factor RsiW